MSEKKKSKVYTITLSTATNYGEVMQEYALHSFLQEMGCDARVIDYRPQIRKKADSLIYSLLKATSLTQKVKMILLFPFQLIRRWKFSKFREKYIKMTSKCYSASDIEKLPQPDAYITGSDQVWNPEITAYDAAYFLEFDTLAHRASYAGSIGNDIINEEEKKKLFQKISQLDCISVRESKILELIPELMTLDAKCHLDPVFLLSKEAYIAIAKKPKISRYILVYEMSSNPQIKIVAEKLAQKENLQIVQINMIRNKYKFDRVISNASPQEFLGLMYYADYIVTNSFHGVAFSIIMNKKFFVLPLQMRSARIENLLYQLNLEERVVKDINNIEVEKIPYECVNKKIMELRNNAKNYLDQVVNKESIDKS
ncbi:MAG: polysaccharide pyruvyl transferase family protein [Lachnospiraceae bacterium]|nr:polysaccharide pyruvyl transferase family protein [Lachnospiraceae bacterium]